ncbi:MAG: glyoxalase/bleomycin resistance/dioxygenase family protein [Acidimicrobiaceae bacterium]|nr:glyoxalase/bleomycin resistance/dioxygenase family protein [Acidimicrobiaceae bacterium]|tara:strand:- start:1197 stop:1607 length:411 start_codon:yes stop_codon:yes gene_type:complete
MRRIHVGMKVDDIRAAVDFYSRLFGAEPTFERTDYAKWMLDEPLLNFSVDLHGDGPSGSAHFGIQVTNREELETFRGSLDSIGLSRSDQNDLVCGYQLQHKSWVTDPDGAMWEVFFTEGIAEGAGYGNDQVPDPAC